MRAIPTPKRPWRLLLLAFVVVASNACMPMYMYDTPGPAMAQGNVATTATGTVDFSYLSRHGNWVRSPRYGTVWVPAANQTPGWRPYYLGQWDYTSYGWTWVSSESWGWGPYHYGRWAWDSMYRWVWIPGYTWGPAWVSWRSGGGCVGWAPLGPRGAIYNQPTYWTFVNQRNIYRTPIRRVVVQPSRSRVIYTQSVRIGRSARVRGSNGRSITYNAGPRPRVVSTWTGTTVRPRAVATMPRVRPRPVVRTRAPAARGRYRVAPTTTRPGYRVAPTTRPTYRPAPTTRPSPAVRPGVRRAPPVAPRYTPPTTRRAPTYRAPATRPVVRTRPGASYRPPTRATAPRPAPRAAPGRSAPGYRRSTPYRSAPKRRSSTSRRSSRDNKSRSRGGRR